MNSQELLLELISKYERWVKVIEGTIAPFTLKAYANTGRLFFRWIETQQVEGITFQQHVEDFVIHLREKEPKLNSRSINRHLAALRQFSNYVDLPLKIRNQRKEKSTRPYITEEEFQGLLQHTKKKPRLYAMIALTYGGGLRLNEVCKLKIEDVDQKGYISVVGKGEKPREVAVEDEVIQMVIPWMRKARMRSNYLFYGQDKSKPQARASFQRRIKRLFQECGIEKKTTHSLRHGGATSLHDLGWDMKEIQEWLGHSNIATTSIYVHTRPKRQRESLVLLGRFKPKVESAPKVEAVPLLS